MNCSNCSKKIVSQNFREIKVSEHSLRAMKKLKPNAKEGDELKICDTCFSQQFPAFAIKFNPPARPDNLGEAEILTAEMIAADKEAVRKRVDELNSSALPDFVKEKLREIKA